MEPFFKTPERIARLNAVAQSWRGTPFAPHAAVRGAGVDCVHLVAAILQECGALKRFAWPRYALDSGSHAKDSQLLAWLDACPNFIRVPRYEIGDVLCFNLGLSEHHIGLLIGGRSGTEFVHVLPKRKVIVPSLTEHYYRRHITAIYRPMEVLDVR